jgi:hypothetical protein
MAMEDWGQSLLKPLLKSFPTGSRTKLPTLNSSRAVGMVKLPLGAIVTTALAISASSPFSPSLDSTDTIFHFPWSFCFSFRPAFLAVTVSSLTRDRRRPLTCFHAPDKLGKRLVLAARDGLLLQAPTIQAPG